MRERFVSASEIKLGELMQRDLSGLELVALMIDKVDFAKHVVLVAVVLELLPKVVDRDGMKTAAYPSA